MSQVLKPKKGYKLEKWLFGKEIEIPEEWNTETLGSTCDQIQDMDHKMPKKINEGVPFLSISDIVNKSEIDFSNQKYISKEDYADFLKKLQPKKNDLLYSRVATIGESRIIREEKNFAFTYNVVLIKTGKKIVSLFLKYALDFPMIKNRVKSIAPQGAYPFLGLGDIEKIPIIVPPLPEQQKIFLILSNVDELINSTQKIIDQTNSLKKGLIQKLLTKGIAHKKFKKVKWYFGKKIEIPEVWKIKSIKEITKKIMKGIFDISPENYIPKGIPFLRVADIENNSLNLSNSVCISDEISKSYSNSELYPNDIILAKVGSIYTNDKISKIPESVVKCNISQNMIGIKTNEEITNSDYLLLEIKRNYQIIVSFSNATTLGALRLDILRNLKIPLPSLPEQQKIASIISNIDSQIQSQTQYKEKLERLKKSLMQKLLTGEVRVTV